MPATVRFTMIGACRADAENVNDYNIVQSKLCIYSHFTDSFRAQEKAKVEYNRIITDAQNAIEQQKNAAIVDVKNMIGKMVIEVTEKVIRRELVNKKDHEEYILKLADDLAETRRGN